MKNSKLKLSAYIIITMITASNVSAAYNPGEPKPGSPKLDFTYFAPIVPVDDLLETRAESADPESRSRIETLKRMDSPHRMDRPSSPRRPNSPFLMHRSESFSPIGTMHRSESSSPVWTSSDQTEAQTKENYAFNTRFEKLSPDEKRKEIFAIDSSGNNKLHDSVLSNNTFLLEFARANLSQEQLVSLLMSRNEDGNNLLHLAASHGHYSLCKRLINLAKETFTQETRDATQLKRKQWLNHQNEDGNTPLHLAAQNGHDEIVTFLLIHCDADTSIENELKQTALMMALSAERQDTAKKLNHYMLTGKLKSAINRGACDDVSEILSDHTFISLEEKNQALHIAVKKGNAIIVNMFLADGAEPNATIRGKSALMRAAELNHAKVVKVLIYNGATVNAQDATHKTAFIYAADHNSIEAMKELLTNAPQDLINNAFLTAVKNGFIDMAKLLLCHNANINFVDSGPLERTALMCAAEYGAVDITLMILGHPSLSTLNYCNSFGHDALMIAAINGYAEIIKILLAHGASTDHTDTGNNTALSLAGKKGNQEVVKLLSAITPLTILQATLIQAVDNHKDETAMLLLGEIFRKVSPDAPDALAGLFENSSPECLTFILLSAARNKHDKVVQSLLEATRLDINLCLLNADRHNLVNLTKIILTCRRNNEITPQGLTTALLSATTNNHGELAQLLCNSPVIDNNGRLIAATYFDLVAEVPTLISRDDITPETLNSALILAAHCNNRSIIELLIEAKQLDISAGLKNAGIDGLTDLVKTLLNHRRHTEILPQVCVEALITAAENGHKQGRYKRQAIVNLLLQCKFIDLEESFEAAYDNNLVYLINKLLQHPGINHEFCLDFLTSIEEVPEELLTSLLKHPSVDNRSILTAAVICGDATKLEDLIKTTRFTYDELDQAFDTAMSTDKTNLLDLINDAKTATSKP